MVDTESLKLWWWSWKPHKGWLHRCACCHGRNRSVSFWAAKSYLWLCGECVYVCDGHCDGTPYRKANR